MTFAFAPFAFKWLSVYCNSKWRMEAWRSRKITVWHFAVAGKRHLYLCNLSTIPKHFYLKGKSLELGGFVILMWNRSFLRVRLRKQRCINLLQIHLSWFVCQPNGSSLVVKNEALLLMMVTFLTNLQESKGRLSDSLCVFQSDRSRRGEQDDDPERGYRVRPNPAEAGDWDGQYGGSYDLSKPDCRTHPSGVWEHFWEVEHL